MLDRWTNTVADIDLYATHRAAEVLLELLLDALPDAVVTWQQQATQHCSARFTFADEEGQDHVAAVLEHLAAIAEHHSTTVVVAFPATEVADHELVALAWERIRTYPIDPFDDVAEHVLAVESVEDRAQWTTSSRSSCRPGVT